MFTISIDTMLCKDCDDEGPSTRYTIREAIEIDKKIQEELIKDHQESENVIKLLLLGPSESGKSTILKQMKIIHLNGYSMHERISKRYLIYKTVIDCMIQLLNGLNLLEIKLSDERQRDANIIRSLSQIGVESLSLTLPTEVHKAIKNLWSEPSVREAFNRRNEFYLQDWAKHFIEAIDRIASPNYIPTIVDILYNRVETVGVSEIKYKVNDLEFKIFDVGGERTQRRKWIHLFDNVHALFFIAAISEYDQVLKEDENMNRLLDSLLLFKTIGNHDVFRAIQIILFLNKKDIFMDKLEKTPLNVCFPNYKYKNDYRNTTLYIKRKFEKQIKDKEKTIYTHLTCATDTDHMNFVMTSISDMIVAKAMKQVGV